MTIQWLVSRDPCRKFGATVTQLEKVKKYNPYGAAHGCTEEEGAARRLRRGPELRQPRYRLSPKSAPLPAAHKLHTGDGCRVYLYFS